MISGLPPLAAKLQFVLNEGKVTAAQIARACGVTDQAINGWRKTGRIAKHHMVTLAEVTGKDLDWWMSGLAPPASRAVKASWDVETVEFANLFSRLSAEERGKLRALLLIARNGIPDERVEQKMPAVKSKKSKAT